MARNDKHIAVWGGCAALLAALLFLSCSPAVVEAPGLLKTAAPARPAETMTLLPALDSRVFPEVDSLPNLEEETPLVIPTAEVMSLARKTWAEEGLERSLVEYQGPLPPPDEFSWRDFPLRALATDLGLGVELKNLTLKKTDRNFLMIPHSVVDALLLPLFSIGTAASRGNYDIAGRALPSSMVKFTVRADVNLISLMGGGMVFTKTYDLELTDASVSEAALAEGYQRSPEDGQEYGRSVAPVLLRDLFSTMARDPEIEYFHKYAQAAWLRRVLADGSVPGEVKVRITRREAAKILPPELSRAQAEGLADTFSNLPTKAAQVYGLPSSKKLEPYAVDPAFAARMQSRSKAFGLHLAVLIEAAGRLLAQTRQRPLTPEEKATAGELSDLLIHWAKTPAGRVDLNRVLSDKDVPWPEKRIALRSVLAVSSEAERQDLIEQKAASWLRLADTTPAEGSETDPRVEAAALLAEAEGPDMLANHQVPFEILVQALTGDDRWAGPVLIDALENGNYDPEVMLLAGAMALEEAKPVFLSILGEASQRDKIPYKVIQPPPPKIPVHPSGPRVIHDGPYPDPVVAARALGGFHGDPAARAMLRRVIAAYPAAFGVNDELAAQAARSLSRIGDPGAAGLLMTTWTRLVKNDEGPQLRQAALGAQPVSAAGRVLAVVRPLIDPDRPVPGAVREAAGYFGDRRYAPAAPYLAQILDHPDPGPSAQAAAFNALARIADNEARTVLEAVARGPRRDLAPQARRFLDKWAAEHAMWTELQRKDVIQ